MIKMRSHRLATKAYRCVARRKGEPNEEAYSRLAHSFPSMILLNGLAQATGFLLAKGKDEHNALLADLNEVLRAAKATASENGGELHREIIKANLSQTMRLTRQALEAGAWIKRYAQGLLEDEEGRSAGAGDE